MTADESASTDHVGALVSVASAGGQLAAVSEVVRALNRQVAFVIETCPMLEPELSAGLDDLNAFAGRCRSALEVLHAKIDVDIRLCSRCGNPRSHRLHRRDPLVVVAGEHDYEVDE